MLAEIDFGSAVSFAGRPMKRKEQYIARLDEVTITREGDSAVIRYKEEGIMTTHLKIGPEIASMSDEAILLCCVVWSRMKRVSWWWGLMIRS